MVKISIALPNHAEINLEAEDTEQLLPVVNLVRQELLRDVASLAAPANGAVPSVPAPPLAASDEPAKPLAASDEPAKPLASPTPSEIPAPSPPPPVAASPEPAPVPVKTTPLVPPSANTIPPTLSNPRLTRDFADFCRNADPIGDMRKVVAAAEGARRHLDMETVDAWELGQLFDLAGWTRAHNFTQTLRNAARHKFKWLERAPGRAGRYAATEKGREVVLGRANIH